MFAYISVMFLCVGLALAGMGGWLMVDARRFGAGAARAPGVVVEMRARPSRMFLRRWERNYLTWYVYFPVVRFRPGGRAEVIVESRTGSSPPQHKVGAQVTVLYDPRDPSKARVESFLSRTGLPFFVAAMGLFVALFGATLLVTAA